MQNDEFYLKRAAEILRNETPLFDDGELKAFVKSFVDRKDVFIKASTLHGSPLYIIEKDILAKKVAQFMTAFKAVIPDIRVHYAIKSNNHPFIAVTLVKAGLGLDVSSGDELKMALDCGAKDILFSGPGKTDIEIELALKHPDRVIILIDSFGELGRIAKAAAHAGKSIRAGVRLTTDEAGLWRKFGIPIADLPQFIREAGDCPPLQWQGIQFHTSWNLNPDQQVNFIKRLATVIAGLEPEQKAQVKFIDIGGGYWPPQGEWIQSVATPEGRLRQAIDAKSESPLIHHRLPSVPIDTFAQGIGRTVRAEIFPHVKCTIFLEPGRWLCHDAMHILLKVIDKKSGDIVITDAGTNTIGWERLESDYFPVINLTRPSLVERECYVLGSLCTPHDVWGYAYFGADIEPGDILLIPTQGAYTYSLRQNFIKPLPKTALI